MDAKLYNNGLENKDFDFGYQLSEPPELGDMDDEYEEDESPGLAANKGLMDRRNYSNPLLNNKGSFYNGRILTEQEIVQKLSSLSNIRRMTSQEPHKRNTPKKNMSSKLNLIDVNYSRQKSNKIKELTQSMVEIKPLKGARNSNDRYILEVKSSGELTLNPKKGISLDDRRLGDVSLSSSEEGIDYQFKGEVDEEIKQQEKNHYQMEMNQLFKIENNFLIRNSSNNIRFSMHSKVSQADLLRTETADFPMKLLTHSLLNEESKHLNIGLNRMKSNIRESDINITSSLGGALIQNRQPNNGTPRFATDEEIEEEEKRLLLSFAFKDKDEIENYKKEMIFIINQEPIIERPPESKFKQLKLDIRRPQPSNKKTLVFTSIDGLFMFSSHAQIVKTCDRTIKIRKDGIKRTIKVFFRPHLYTFLKTLSQYFEMALYLREDAAHAIQWIDVLNSVSEGGNATQHKKGKTAKKSALTNIIDTNQPGQQNQKQFFDIILTKEHCIIDRQMRAICRNREIFLDGRSPKNILFVSNDLKDTQLVHQNSIFVRSYYGNKYENTLAKLKVYLLKHILECQDVREVARRDFLCHTKNIAQIKSKTSQPHQKQEQKSNRGKQQ